MRLTFLAIAATWCIAFAAVVPAHAQHGHAATGPHSPHATQHEFDAAMGEAMRRMNRGMAIAHTGNADRDFAAMMIPHHQGAIDMARAELLYGHDPVLRRLAEGIIVEQQQEIELMRRELERLDRSPQNPDR
jgi:uncharacterized protein (DUF305 family)